ncbi:hypothetical protein GF336_03480 [Candidatus Woesearchaeota archaeon]|nr:hypothetical protein [Candidatus Woesearchaeota archaeon]
MDNQIKKFMENNKLEKIIAFSGGADEKKEKVERIIEDSILYFKNKPIGILTGGTYWGIPKFATDIAKDYGLKTIGVMPERGEKYSLDNLDLKIKVPPKYGNSEYGDESEVFAKLADGVEIIGGSAGTAIESYHIIKINSRIIDYIKKETTKETPKIIAPIAGLGGFSEEIYSIQSAKGMIPPSKIFEGGDAAKYLLSKLDIY